MKKQLFFIVCIFLANISLGFAQKGAQKLQLKPEDRAAKQTLRLKNLLSLTAEQEPQVQQFNLEAAKKTHELKTQFKATAKIADKKTIRQEMKANQDARDAKIEALLTDSQKVKFKEYRAKQAEKRKNAKDEEDDDDV
jgi:hypothetical protein